MAHTHIVVDTDTRFTIDKTTREINSVTGNATIMQYDHNSERLTFELPKVIDGHDMTRCNEIQVHYINIDSSTKDSNAGVYLVEDLKIDPDNAESVVMSWLISSNATKFAGVLNFLIKFKCVVDGVVEYAWNTAIYKGMTVSSGIDNGEIAVVPYSDVLEQWRLSLVEAAGDAVLFAEQSLTDEQQAQARENIGAISQEQLNEALENVPGGSAGGTDEGANKKFANAIYGERSGKTVRVENAEQNPNAMGLNIKLERKNLLVYPYVTGTTTTSGITFAVNGDGTITVSGEATNAGAFAYATSLTLQKGEYVFSGLPAELRTYGSYAYVQNLTTGEYYQDAGNGIRFDLAEETTVRASVIVGNGFKGTDFPDSNNSVTIYPQLEKGITPTEYAPYNVDVTEVEVRLYNDSEDDVSTYTPNADGILENVPACAPETNIATDSDAVFLMVTYNKNINEALSGVERSPLYGKKLSCNGDSICQAVFAGGGYPALIGKMYNMQVQNIGISGGTIVSGTTEGARDRHWICRTIENMDVDADYAIVEGGCNDAGIRVPLGAMTDGYGAELDDTTFYGAFESMLKQLLLRFAGKKVGYIAVHQTPNFSSMLDGETSYYLAAKKCCAKWGVPFLDLNTTVPPFGLLELNQSSNQDLYNALCVPYTTNGDGLHPTEEGYKKYYVPKIVEWMKTL